MVATQTKISQRQSEGWQQLPSQWPDCLRRILAARGIRTEQDMYYELAQLPRPDLLSGMQQAVELLYQALQQQWHVTIVADFDSDGATSCAVAIRGLKALGLQHIDYMVPNRFTHGYGLTEALLADLAETNQPDLLLTVDNGIAACAGVKAAQVRGMKVLVTDHHLPGEDLPEADAIVNPNQTGDTFPSKNLAGVGVCFYLLLGLRQYLREQNWFTQQREEPRLVELLDLVALGTVADVVPLDRLNRTLVDLGLKRIRAGHACAAIKALLQISGKVECGVTTTDLAFAVAPKLNAAGRMDDMGLGIETLLSDDSQQALVAVQTLDEINRQRREVEQSMQQDAESMLKRILLAEASQNNIYCLYDPSWHQGVIGLLASRVKDRVNRPVIAFAPGDEGELKGSARSITGIHIRDVLARVAADSPHLLQRFGGHAMAAGLSLKLQDLAEFEEQLQHTIESMVDPSVYQQKLVSDGELSSDEMKLSLAEMLPIAAPWGQGFDEPRFHGRFRVIECRHVGQDNDHLRLTIELADKRLLTAMAFRQTQPEWLQQGDDVLLRYRLDVNEYRSNKSLQLLVDNLLPAN